MIIKRRICDLCHGEKNQVRLATHQYTAPFLHGAWIDGCQKHTEEMRDVGIYEIRIVQQPDDLEE